MGVINENGWPGRALFFDRIVETPGLIKETWVGICQGILGLFLEGKGEGGFGRAEKNSRR